MIHLPFPKGDVLINLIIDTQKKYKIFFDPIRQEILSIIKTSPKPLTINEIGIHIGFSNSKTHYHIQKLIELNAIHSEFETITNGIISKHFNISYQDVDIKINEQEHLTKSLVINEQMKYHQTSFTNNLSALSKQYDITADRLMSNQTCFGINYCDEDLYLSFEKRQELKDYLSKFVSENSIKPDDTSEYTKTHVFYTVYDKEIHN